MSKMPRIRPHQLLYLGMPSLPLLSPGKLAASLAQTFLSSLTERCSVQQGRSLWSRSVVEKLMGACASSMAQAFGVVGLVHYAPSVNGMALRRLSHAR